MCFNITSNAFKYNQSAFSKAAESLATHYLNHMSLFLPLIAFLQHCLWKLNTSNFDTLTTLQGEFQWKSC